MDEMKAPNREYLEFTFVKETATGKGLNQSFVMEADKNNTNMFTCTEGRIGVRVGPNKPKTWRVPLSEWDTTYLSKTNSGWLLTKTQKIEAKKIVHEGTSVEGRTYKTIEEPETRRIVDFLLSLSTQTVEESYTTRVECISDEMINLGRTILTQMGNTDNISIAAFNNLLKRLYAVIPRRIDNLSAKLAKSQTEFGKIVEAENDMLDLLIAQMKLSKVAADNNQTITEAFGLQWRLATDEEKTFVLKQMDAINRGCVTAIWRVVNEKTEKRFNDWCSVHNYTEENGISHLFHGSPAQNWWSITTNGLWIRPGLNGGMFGPGLYFAPESDKSIGYTGYGCWRSQGDAYGYLSLNKVATGKPFWFYQANGSCQDMSLTAMKRRGTDCLWAESSKKNNRSTLRRDEVIIYDDAQSTIEYLIETKNPSAGY